MKNKIEIIQKHNTSLGSLAYYCYDNSECIAVVNTEQKALNFINEYIKGKQIEPKVIFTLEY